MNRFSLLFFFLCNIYLNNNIFTNNILDSIHLRNVPFAEDLGIVTNSKTIIISDATCAANPSIVQMPNNQYLLAYRDNRHIKTCSRPYTGSWNKTLENYDSFIGLATLDEHFNQNSKSVFLPQEFTFMEDPRLFYYQNSLYIMHGHNLFLNGRRILYPILSKINSDGTSYNPKCLDTIIQQNSKSNICVTEKNWTPFNFDNKRLFFIQQFNPLKILELINNEHVMVYSIKREKNPMLVDLWEKNWGEIRGGSPALLDKNEGYLAFFHSSITKDNTSLYTFGAIIFSATPPFNIKKISKFPIITKEMYSTPISYHSLLSKSSKRFYVTWPAGYIIDQINNKTYYHVICGENESMIKILTINKEELLKNMYEIAPERL